MPALTLDPATIHVTCY